MKVGAAILLALAACSGSNNGNSGDDGTTTDAPGSGSGSADAPTSSSHKIDTIFVIPLENKADTAIYGNMTDAPYINGLFTTANHATNFKDELPSLDSEPHYIWMEAGTNAFADHTFSTDNDAAASNSTSSTDHLVTQLKAANIPWMSYQEDLTAACPISSSSITSTSPYATKHDPFVFFQDVSGSPPSASNTYCAAHHKAYSSFATDLAAGMTGYVFITPNLCHDMHGAATCSSGLSSSPNIKAGDTWLKAELPRIIDYTKTHNAVIFLVWDEGSSTNTIPFLALGAHVKVGTSDVMYTHSSLLKTTEELLGVPVLAKVTAANDFADMFDPGTF